MEIVEAEAEPRRVRRQSALAKVGDYLGVRTLALGAAALLVIGLLSWNVLLQDQVQDLQGQVEDARNQRQVQQRLGHPSDGIEMQIAELIINRNLLKTAA